MKAIGIIAGREFRETLRSKSYAIVTVLGLLGFVVLSFLPTLINWLDRKSEPVVVVADRVGGMLDMLSNAPNKSGSGGNRTVRFIAPPSELQIDKKTLDEQVSAGKIGAYVLISPVPGRTEPLFQLGAKHPSSALIRGVELAVQPIAMQRRLTDLHIAPQQAARLQAPLLAQVSNIDSRFASQNQLMTSQALAYLLLFMLYVTLIGYGSVLAQGVAAEKGSRVMEMMLVSVRPTDLLAGKILGLGAATLVQYLIWVVVGLGVSWARGTLDNVMIGGVPLQLSAVAPATILYFLLYYVLGYLAYSALFASAGCLVNRPEETSQTQMPVMIVVIASYIVAVMALANPGGSVARIASLIPFVTPMVMFTRIVMSSVPVVDIVLSVLFSLVFTWLAILAGGRVYRYSVLRTRRSGWFESLRGARG